MTCTCERAQQQHRPSCRELNLWSLNLLLNSLDWDLSLRHDGDADDLGAELQLRNGVASVLCRSTGIHHIVAELRLGISTVFCACWTSDAASQQTRLPLNSRTALVEFPLSSELKGWSVPGVASQPGTSTIQSVIRFEMRSW